MLTTCTIFIVSIKQKGGENVGSYTLKEVDDKLWRKVKSLAALRGMTIKELILDLLEREVKKGV